MGGDSRGVARDGWEKFLNPKSLRFNLSIGAAYLTAYELLLDALVERLRRFYATVSTKQGPQTGPGYREHVLVRHRMPYFASADWFVEMGALDAADIQALREVRAHRNFVAHNIPRIVMEAGAQVDSHLLEEIVRLVAKLDRWWLHEVELPANPDLDTTEASEEDLDQAASLRMHNLELLISFARGDEKPLRAMHSAFEQIWPSEPV